MSKDLPLTDKEIEALKRVFAMINITRLERMYLENYPYMEAEAKKFALDNFPYIFAVYKKLL